MKNIISLNSLRKIFFFVLFIQRQLYYLLPKLGPVKWVAA